MQRWPASSMTSRTSDLWLWKSRLRKRSAQQTAVKDHVPSKLPWLVQPIWDQGDHLDNTSAVPHGCRHAWTSQGESLTCLRPGLRFIRLDSNASSAYAEWSWELSIRKIAWYPGPCIFSKTSLGAGVRDKISIRWDDIERTALTLVWQRVHHHNFCGPGTPDRSLDALRGQIDACSGLAVFRCRAP